MLQSKQCKYVVGRKGGVNENMVNAFTSCSNVATFGIKRFFLFKAHFPLFPYSNTWQKDNPTTSLEERERNLVSNLEDFKN